MAEESGTPCFFGNYFIATRRESFWPSQTTAIPPLLNARLAIELTCREFSVFDSLEDICCQTAAFPGHSAKLASCH